MFFLLFMSCQEKDVVGPSGSELLESYHSEHCLLYTDVDCGLELSQCGQPVTMFTDWAQCMNAQNQRTSLCGQLPSVLEEDPQNI